MIGALTDWQSWAMTTGGVLVAIGLLYLLRPRRRQIQVPFGGLWQRVLAKAEARALGRRWRRLFSMLAIWAIAGLMLAALGEPLVGLRGCSGPPDLEASHTILLIDTSASMATLDGVPLQVDVDAIADQRISRLDEARARLREVIASARPAERFLVVSAAGRLHTRSGWTSDAAVLKHTITTLQAGQAGLDLRQAWAAAQDALTGRLRPRIVWISDGGPALQAAPVPAGVEVLSIQVGRPPAPDRPAGFDNLAVERVGIRPSPADPGRGTLTVRIRNDRARAVNARVTIMATAEGQTAADFSGPAALKTTRTEEIGARSARWLQFNQVDLSAGRFAVRVQPSEQAEWRDLAGYDDRAYAVAAIRRPLKVLLVSDGNLFLEAALLANPRLTFHKEKPETYRPERWAAADRALHHVDLVVLDRVAAPPPPGQPHLRFDPLAHANTLAGTKYVGAPEMVIAPGEHPLLRGLSLQDTNADRARILEVPQGAEVLIRARGNGPLAVASSEGLRRVVIGLDLYDTDLGGRLTLPILMGNTIDWLAGDEEALLPPLDLGRVWAIEAPVRGLKWTYRQPGGDTTPARVAGDQLIASSELHGIHQWHGSDGTILARSTRLAATERPGLQVALGRPWQPPPSVEQARGQPASRPPWQWLLLLAMVALLVEWPLYLRRRTV